MKVAAFRCAACEALFDAPGDPLYECSRCGSIYPTDENRCIDCHIFMAKVAEQSCPECEDGESIEACEAWRGADGKLCSSEGAEQDWIAAAPEREKATAESQRFLDSHLAASEAESAERNARLLPRLKALRPLIADRCPQLAQSVIFNIEDIERDPSTGGTVTAMLNFGEMAQLFAPELVAELAVARDYDAPYQERSRAEAAIRAEILRRVTAPELVERFDQASMFCAGSGLGFAMEDAVDGLLAALGRSR